MQSILFVCLGNICRSPLAEGSFRALISQDEALQNIKVDSAGNGAWHEGNPPDPRAIEIAASRGIDISSQRSRHVKIEDFQRFDLVLCMDQENLDRLSPRLPVRHKAHLDLFLNFTNGRRQVIEDPYYGGMDGFAHVYEKIHKANQRLVEKLKSLS